jgi:hypothetical protein
MFHKHNWNLIDKTIIPPALPRSTRVKASDPFATISFIDGMTEHVVHVFKCDCGKVKVEKN